MATLAEFRQILVNLPRELARTQADDALIFLNDVIAQGKLRVAETGRDSEGDSFSFYSRGYAKRRRERGRQSTYKDYNDTGQLDASKRAEIQSSGTDGTVGVITVRGSDNEAKVAGNQGHEIRKRGVSAEQANLLTPSQEEIENATAAYAERRINKVRKILNQ